jgi:hypothetical protein
MKIIINDDPERGPTVEIEDDGHDTFVVVSGVPVARRGHPDTREAGTCVPLEPGWIIRSSEDGDRTEITIMFDGNRVIH